VITVAFSCAASFALLCKYFRQLHNSLIFCRGNAEQAQQRAGVLTDQAVLEIEYQNIRCFAWGQPGREFPCDGRGSILLWKAAMNKRSEDRRCGEEARTALESGVLILPRRG
jgi:hypothetical protein